MSGSLLLVEKLAGQQEDAFSLPAGASGSFYRKFVCGAACVLAPLRDALKGPGKSLTWSQALDSPFSYAKDLLAAVPELVHPCLGAQISLAVNTSFSHMVYVLMQLLDGSWAPLVFFSKKMSRLKRSTPPLTGSYLHLLFSLALLVPPRR